MKAGRDLFPIREYPGTTRKLVGKYLSIPATKKWSDESFVIVFLVAPKMVQVWEEKSLK